MPLFSSFEVIWVRYSLFVFLWFVVKCSASIDNNKIAVTHQVFPRSCTLVFLTFKVEESKVHLFFDQTSYERVMSNSSSCDLWFDVPCLWKQQNDYILPRWCKIMKVSALSFLQLLKLKKIMWPYFFLGCYLSKIWAFSDSIACDLM